MMNAFVVQARIEITTGSMEYTRPFLSNPGLAPMYSLPINVFKN